MGSSNGIVINASTRRSFTRGLARTDNAGLSCCGADGIVKKKEKAKQNKKQKKRERPSLQTPKANTQTAATPSSPPIHLFSRRVARCPGEIKAISVKWCFHALRHAHFAPALKCKWTLFLHVIFQQAFSSLGRSYSCRFLGLLLPFSQSLNKHKKGTVNLLVLINLRQR